MSNFKCSNNEKELGRWTTNMIPHGGGRYTGQLVLTTQRLVFHAQFDTSLGGVIGDLFFNASDAGTFITIPKENIREVEPKISFLNKRIVLSTDNDQKYVIDNGMLPVQSILDALSKQK
jgi:hypothetical protein